MNTYWITNFYVRRNFWFGFLSGVSGWVGGGIYFFSLEFNVWFTVNILYLYVAMTRLTQTISHNIKYFSILRYKHYFVDEKQEVYSKLHFKCWKLYCNYMNLPVAKDNIWGPFLSLSFGWCSADCISSHTLTYYLKLKYKYTISGATRIYLREGLFF